MKHWYVVQAQTGGEIKVKNEIYKSIPGTPAVVPRRELKERRQGVVRKVVRPLFPGYVFLQLPGLITHPALYYQVKNISGVYRFLGTGTPAVVPPAEMQHILRWCSDGDLIGFSNVIAGAEIKVIDGPLAGMEGRIVKVDQRKGRAKVRLMILGEQREIDLGVEVVKAS